VDEGDDVLGMQAHGPHGEEARRRGIDAGARSSVEAEMIADDEEGIAGIVEIGRGADVGTCFVEEAQARRRGIGEDDLDATLCDRDAVLVTLEPRRLVVSVRPERLSEERRERALVGADELRGPVDAYGARCACASEEHEVDDDAAAQTVRMEECRANAARENVEAAARPR
jgi:hypothetical protein